MLYTDDNDFVILDLIHRLKEDEKLKQNEKNKLILNEDNPIDEFKNIKNLMRN